MYIHRYLEETILQAHQTFKILYLGGPRQVGKTTLLRHLSEKLGFRYVTFDDLSLRSLAQKDPEFFLDQYPAPLILDEVQYVPQLFPALKHRVDQSERRGQYWLTGSQHFSSMQHIQESLAGRVAIFSLLGLSSAEIDGLTRLDQPFSPTRESHPVTIKTPQSVFERIFTGSFPARWQDTPPPLELFYNSYLQTYIDRDLRDLFGVTKLTEFHTFLQLCAARTGQILNYSELARDASISVHAAREWISILESTGNVYLLRPFAGNISKRLIKSPKLYLLDTGLAAYLTRWTSAETLAAGAMAGAFFETFVVSEIVKSYLFRGKQPPLYYMRDSQGHEVDLLLEQDQKHYLMEIKIASTINDYDAKNINFFTHRDATVAHSNIISLTKHRHALNRTIDVLPVGEIS